MRDRRRLDRLDIASNARYTKVRGCITIQSLGLVKNISPGGLCAYVCRIIGRRDQILVEISLPYADKTLVALARVAWARPISNNGHNMCGLKFVWVSSDSTLDDYVRYAREKSGLLRKE